MKTQEACEAVVGKTSGYWLCDDDFFSTLELKDWSLPDSFCSTRQGPGEGRSMPMGTILSSAEGDIERFSVKFRSALMSRAAKQGGFKRGGFPIWTCPSFFVLFCPFWDFPDFSGIFPICLGMVWGFSRFVLFLFLGLLRAPTRNSPERVRDTIWTFPEKSGKHPGLETPRFSFSQLCVNSLCPNCETETSILS